MSDSGYPASIERQLGEVVGTLKMTVLAVDKLSNNVEVLTQRAAFKGDLETIKIDIRAEMKLDSEKLEAIREELSQEISESASKIDDIRKWMYITQGSVAAILGLISYFRPFANLLGGH